MAFSADAHFLAAAQPNGTVWVWDTSDLTRELTRVQRPRSIDQLGFSSDNRYLISTDNDSARWDVWRQEDAIAEACARSRGEITPEEWARHIPRDFLQSTERFRMSVCAADARPVGR
jgi:hypothetical protein